MSFSRVMAVLRKDLGRGPRSPAFLYALLMPVLITLVTKVILLSLFDPEPRLGIADLGRSEITAASEQMERVHLTRASSAAELRRLVESNDVDVGLVIGQGFDAAVRAGERPRLDLFISGESRASHRLVLAITSIDLVRRIEGRESPARVVTNSAGGGSALPIEDLIVLGILLWPLLVCSTLVPGLMLVQEKEARTLEAIMVTPTTLAEILIAKACLGFGMAMLMCLLTLLLCGALTAEPLALLVTLSVSIALCTGIGLVYGATAKDGKTVYNMAQTMNMVILAPLLFYFFPGWPQWIAKIFPSYWFIDPLYRIALRGASLAEVWTDLAIALVVAVLMLIPITLLARRMQAKLAA